MPYIGPNSHINQDKTLISLEQYSHGMTYSLEPLYANVNKEYAMVSLFLCIERPRSGILFENQTWT